MNGGLVGEMRMRHSGSRRDVGDRGSYGRIAQRTVGSSMRRVGRRRRRSKWRRMEGCRIGIHVLGEGTMHIPSATRGETNKTSAGEEDVKQKKVVGVVRMVMEGGGEGGRSRQIREGRGR